MPKTTVSISTNGVDFKELNAANLKSLVNSDYPNDGPEVEILAASLKGDFCHYVYEFSSGVLKGDGCNHKGTNIVHDDLKKAFKKLHVHLAVACEEIDQSDIKDIDSIPEWDVDADHPKRLTALEEVSRKVFHFSCSSYKCDGTGENEGVIMIGQKRLTTGEFVKLESPKVMWSGEYHFINELKVAVDDISHEVQLYRNGKFAPKFEQGELSDDGAGDGKEED
jgi:hypothetical protein